MTRLTLSEQFAALQLVLDATKTAEQAALARVEEGKRIYALEITNLKAVHAAANTELEKKVKEKESSYTYQASLYTQASGELEQAHAVLDGVEGAPPRAYDKDYGQGQRNVVTRLAGAFLAIARQGVVK